MSQNDTLNIIQKSLNYSFLSNHIMNKNVINIDTSLTIVGK